MKIPNRYINAKIDPSIKLDFNESWYLYGVPGTGKTYFIWAYRIDRHNKLKSEEEKKPNMIFDKLYVRNWAMFCSQLRYSAFDKREPIIKDLINVDRLIIDDIGSEVKTDFSDDILFQILNERYEWERWTGFTSNHNVADLQYDGRIISRIAGIVGKNKFEITGKDRRI